MHTDSAIICIEDDDFTVDSLVNELVDKTVLQIDSDAIKELLNDVLITDVCNNSELIIENNSIPTTLFQNDTASQQTASHKLNRLNANNNNNKLKTQLIKLKAMVRVLKTEKNELQSKCQERLNFVSCAKVTKSVQTDEFNISKQNVALHPNESSNNFENDLLKVS